ncbi:MAG: GAF domain-containing protein [Gammaproteobacteria bacterium]|nr:GAF domain-containing protein [Gammaproteobacteria bacterium]
MDKAQALKRIDELKARQQMINKTWQKTVNRELLDFFVDILPRLLDAERCGIFIHDPVKNDVWLHAGTGLQAQELTVPVRTSLVGRVISSGEAVIENDLDNQIGAHDAVAIKTGFITYTAICVPIFGASRQRVTGAVEVLNKKRGLHFDEQDKQLLERVARLIQIQVENLFARQELINISEEINKQIAMLEKRLAG